MIALSEIQSNLQNLDRLFSKSRSQKEALYYSKLAIIELCGWIEMSMDDIILRCAMRKLKLASNKKLAREFVKKNYGFHYSLHFRNMLTKLVGLIALERIERRLDQAKFIRLEAELSKLKLIRDPEAHTFIKGITRQIDSPSITLAQFHVISDGLLDYDRILRMYV